MVNYDMHGTPGSGKETSYKAQRGVAGDEGTLTAGFDGSHGWFWRNRGKQDVKISLHTEGAYTENQAHEMRGAASSHLWPGVPLALGSAVLFGATAPLSKLLLGKIDAQLLAGLLYLGGALA